jgi:hypothetical protein
MVYLPYSPSLKWNLLRTSLPSRKGGSYRTSLLHNKARLLIERVAVVVVLVLVDGPSPLRHPPHAARWLNGAELRDGWSRTSCSVWILFFLYAWTNDAGYVFYETYVRAPVRSNDSLVIYSL